MTDLIFKIHGKNLKEIRELIEGSRIYTRHKEALFTILDHGSLPEEMLIAAAKRLISTEESLFEKKATRTEMMSRIAPMFGTDGNADPSWSRTDRSWGRGDTMTLSDSLIIAFDTTVAGLITAAVCYVIAKIRRRWYDDYMVSLETLMDSVLEETSRERPEEGGILK